MTAPLLRRFSPLLLLTLGLSLLATPAGATPATHPTASANPDLGNACGLDFLVVLDRSGSVAPSAAKVRDAANSFLGAMVDTGSKAGVVSFANDAATNVAPAALTSASLGGFTSAVNGLSFSGSTNWDAGLVQGRSLFSSYADGRPDLVVVVTDGNPNRYVNDTTGSIQGPGSGFDQTSQDQAVLQANLMKAAGAHVFAIGVGGNEGLNTAALQAISGPDEWTSGAAFGTADWTRVTSYDELKTKLADIATALCHESVIVHKTLDGQPAAGWQFHAGDGVAPQSTDAEGIATFSWTSPSAVSVDLVESPRAGFALASAACTLGDTPVGQPLDNGGVHLSVGPLDTIQCTFHNRTLVPGLTLTKTAVNTDHPDAGGASAHPGDHITYTFAVENTGELPLTAVTVTDDKLGAIGVVATLAAGETKDLTYDYVVPAGQTADVINTATACGTVGEEQDPACDTATHTLGVLNPAIRIDKTAEPMTVSPSGSVTYHYVVSNIGDVALSGVMVDDDVLGPIGTVASLAVGESKAFDKTVTITASTPARNVATATGTDPLGAHVSDQDDVTISIVQAETITTTTTTTTTTAAPVTLTTAGPVATTPAAPAQAAPAVAPTDVFGVTAELPRTGWDPRGLLLPAGVLILAGLVLLAGTRKARRA